MCRHNGSRTGWAVTDRQAPDKARAESGAELAAYRRAARCSQARLAQLTGYSRSTIANVKTGRQHVPRNFWERADAALRTGGTLATGHDELEAAHSTGCPSSRTCADARIRSQVPSAVHRRSRSWQVFHRPYRSGRSRHGAPVRSFHKIPLITCR